MNAKYKLFGSLVVLLILGLSVISGPVKSNYTVNPNLKQSEEKYAMTLTTTAFSDNDGDGHDDTVTYTFLINGTASTSVLLTLYAATTMYIDYYFFNDEVTVNLNSTGYAVTSISFQANRSARYSIDFDLVSLDHSKYYDSMYFDVYLDGYNSPWIPEPSFVSFYNSTYYDNDNDGYYDEVIFYVELNDTSEERYLTSLSINYTYGWSLGAMSYYSPSTHYTTIYNDSNTFSFIFDFVAEHTGDYYFDLNFYDSYGRNVYYMYLYPNHRLDGTQDPYADYNIWTFLYSYDPVNSTHPYIDSLFVDYGFDYDPNNGLESKNVTINIELWNVGYDYWYDQYGNVHVGSNAYMAASANYKYPVSNQQVSVRDNVTLNVNTASNYVLIFQVFCGVYWANYSFSFLIPVGQFPGKDPIHLEQVSTSLVDTNNDGLEDTYVISGMIYTDLYSNSIDFYVELYVKSVNYDDSFYYVDGRYYNGTSPTIFNFTLSFTADHEDDYLFALFLSTPWNANYSMTVHQDQAHLYGNSPTSTSTSTSTYTNTTSSSTSETENSNATTSSTSPTSEEPVQSSETNSSTPQLPLPFQFNTVVITFASLGLMMLVVRKYKK